MKRVVASGAFALGVLMSPLAAGAAQHPGADQHLMPTRQGDVTYLTGGVGASEQEAFRERSGDYNLWVTLTRPDGAYLADVEVRIENGSGKTVLDATTTGPFLMAQLPPGRYTVRTTADGWRAAVRTVDVPSAGQDRVYIAMKERTGADRASAGTM